MKSNLKSGVHFGVGIGMWFVLGLGLPSSALAQADSIERGRKLFFEETFDGNGRTCGTCHPATNNFTIDPAFIRKLPRRDPLFVAEFNPKLKGLENNRLLRRFGLILENLDGFDRPGVLRAVPHSLALRTNKRSNLRGSADALGWSGDGAPDNGSLRAFSKGAVIQHFPKSLDREVGVDFRLPTNAELRDLEAFMLSLGRQREIDLDRMTFTEKVVNDGKALFNGEGVNRSCAICHENAGGNFRAPFSSPDNGFNANFDTGTRSLSPRGAPPDGGFGDEPVAGVRGFGNGEMNTPSIIEAADTAPFFHNNSERTLEGAIDFYTRPVFGNSPAGQLGGAGAFELNRKQINAIGALLRTLNAMENIRFSNVIGEAAQRTSSNARAKEQAKEARSETNDAITVLSRGPKSLYKKSVRLLRRAAALERRASRTNRSDTRNALLDDAIAAKNEARALMTE